MSIRSSLPPPSTRRCWSPASSPWTATGSWMWSKAAPRSGFRVAGCSPGAVAPTSLPLRGGARLAAEFVEVGADVAETAASGRATTAVAGRPPLWVRPLPHPTGRAMSASAGPCCAVRSAPNRKCGRFSISPVALSQVLPGDQIDGVNRLRPACQRPPSRTRKRAAPRHPRRRGWMTTRGVLDEGPRRAVRGAVVRLRERRIPLRDV
jgi:hypothetical protein